MEAAVVCVCVPPYHGIYPYLTSGKQTWVNEMTPKARFLLIIYVDLLLEIN